MRLPRPPAAASLPGPLRLLLWALSMLLLVPLALADQSSSSSSSSSSTLAPGGFSSKGELPQMDFARLGAYRFSSPSLCARVGNACYLLCARKRRVNDHHELKDEEVVERGGAGLHLIGPGIGCLCQGQDGDALQQVAMLRREAERYQAAFGHPIPARTLALRLAEALQGKGQQTWSRPPACVTVLAAWSPLPSSHEDDASSSSSDNGGRPELYQVDPVGMVLPVRGAAFGGVGIRNAEGEEDPTASDLNAWLAGALMGKDGEGAEEEEGEGAGVGDDEALPESLAAHEVWRRLWGGMRRCFPGLEGKEAEVDCAMACAGSRKGVGGFRLLGTLDRVLKAAGP